MRNKNTTSTGTKSGFGIGLSGLAGLIGGIVAFATVPGFGAGLAAVTGLGTWAGAVVGGTVLAIGGLVAGATVFGVGGLLIGALAARPGAGLAAGAAIGAVTCAIGGGLAGTVGGAYTGYNMTKDALVKKECKNEFNQKAFDCPTDGTAPTVKITKTSAGYKLAS